MAKRVIRVGSLGTGQDRYRHAGTKQQVGTLLSVGDGSGWHVVRRTALVEDVSRRVSAISRHCRHVTTPTLLRAQRSVPQT